MTRRIPLPALLALLTLGLAALAQEPEAPRKAPALEEVVVTAPPIESERRTTIFGKRIDSVSEEQIDALNAQDLTSALRRVPGVVISRYNPIGSTAAATRGRSSSAATASPAPAPRWSPCWTASRASSASGPTPSSTS